MGWKRRDKSFKGMVTYATIGVLVLNSIIPVEASLLINTDNRLKSGEAVYDLIYLSEVASRYGTKSGENDFDASFDLNNDGEVDIFDLVIVARQIEEEKTLGGSDISGLNSQELPWWYVSNNNHEVPSINSYIPFDFKKYDTMYVGDTSRKVLYLSFDTEFDMGNDSVLKILDILKENNVKANFFLISLYLDNWPSSVKKIEEGGHLVANHSSSHQSMPSFINDKEKFQNEIKLVEQKYKSITGKKITKYFRPPMGLYSEQTLKYTQDLGYKSVFWSFAYDDYDVNNQPSKEYAKNLLFNSLHNGEIILMHSFSETSRSVLDEFIKEAKRQGYEFELLP